MRFNGCVGGQIMKREARIVNSREQKSEISNQQSAKSKRRTGKRKSPPGRAQSLLLFHVELVGRVALKLS